ncbi:PAS domain S-box-containing protein/diguanylate cyclase (GGDEF)-like protein [Paenibacillus taihuensis]|uniref:PAS domain S-box-containing protein/diguanylate cyclase (GGDEF)-like protein n=1 Tax=Paenibacillus taihuensis TaxID=1156355 RepID=A0A3D9R0Z7_9BACL|nr:EAL domain-containing protein [Paenibacillus taihuensis]REE66718.1 PAS domain S-box-containing protein/diguanylate cyclase (GGDEF)-like protein [Paenibacillus taihuensis]
MAYNHIHGSYNWFLVCLSFIIALFASYTGLNLARRVVLSDGWKRKGWLASGAFIMGTGIWSMHFIAMLAFKLPSGVTYDLITVLVSIGASFIGSLVGFGFASLGKQKLSMLIAGGLFMGLAISGMHYIGMYALTGVAITYNPLLLSFSIIIAVLTSIAALLFAFRNNTRYWMSGLIMGIAITGMHYTGMSAANMSIPTDMLDMRSDMQADSFLEIAIYVAFGTIVIFAVSLIGSMNADKKLSEQMMLKGSILESAIDCLIMFDHKGRIFEFNPAAERMFDVVRGEVIGQSISRFLLPAHIEVHEPVNRMLAQGSKSVLGARIETVLSRCDQSGFPVEITVTRIKKDKLPVYTMYLRDLTARKQVEEALRESEERYRKLIDFSPEPIIVHKDGIITFINDAGLQTLGGVEQQALIGTRILELVQAEYRQKARLWIADVEAGVARTDSIEMKVVRADGNAIDIEAKSILVQYGGETLIQTIARDITDKKLSENTIKKLAYFDMLTGLPNRNWFNMFFPELLHKAKEGGYSVAVMFLDLDRFKLINDTMGHLMGDRLLQRFAKLLSECAGGENRLVSRLSGDEFVIIVPGSGRSDVVKLAETIIKRVAAPIDLEGQAIFITTSIGIAQFPDDGETPEVLLRHADSAMYAAKENGKNQFKFFEWKMNHTKNRRLAIEQALHAALEERQFHLVYQPIFQARTRQIISMEALVRWQHPTMGAIGPDEFIPIAECTGHIIPLGEWILHQACSQLHQWHCDGMVMVPIAVNLSVVQFNQERIVEMIRETLERTNLAPEYLVLEITESMAMNNNHSIIDRLQQLKSLGIGISIDDFGTGYSSLSYLRRFPVDTLKIDKSFVHDLCVSSSDTAIVEAIIALAKSLKLCVLAEGVETEQQLQILAQKGCTDMQGYWLSHPLTAEQIESMYLGEMNRIG